MSTADRPAPAQEAVFAPGLRVEIRDAEWLPGLDKRWNETFDRLHEAEITLQDAVLKIQHERPYTEASYELLVLQACRNFSDIVVQEFAATMAIVYKSKNEILTKLERAVESSAERILRKFFGVYTGRDCGRDYDHYLEQHISYMKLRSREIVESEGERRLTVVPPIKIVPDSQVAAKETRARIRANWFDHQLELRGWTEADFRKEPYLDPKTLRRFLGGEHVREDTRKKIQDTFNSKRIGAKLLRLKEVPS